MSYYSEPRPIKNELAETIVMIVLWGSLIVGVVAGIPYGLYQWSWHLHTASCASFGEETGYATKQVMLNWADWQCLAEIDGTWVPRYQIIFDASR